MAGTAMWDFSAEKLKGQSVPASDIVTENRVKEYHGPRYHSVTKSITTELYSQLTPSSVRLAIRQTLGGQIESLKNGNNTQQEKYKCFKRYLNKEEFKIQAIDKRRITAYFTTIHDNELHSHLQSISDDGKPLIHRVCTVVFNEKGEGVQDVHRGNPDAVMVDFANKIIGGGVLGHGAVQEEIMMCQFPEMLHARIMRFSIVSEGRRGMTTGPTTLGDYETVFMTGLKWVNDTDGYGSDTFKYDRPHQAVSAEPDTYNVLIMDALNLKDTSKQAKQKSYGYTMRELKKAFCGFHGCLQNRHVYIDQVITGNWGCGVFGGDPEHKIIIQILAMALASLVSRPLPKQPITIEFCMVDPQVRKRVTELLAQLVTVKRLWDHLFPSKTGVPVSDDDDDVKKDDTRAPSGAEVEAGGSKPVTWRTLSIDEALGFPRQEDDESSFANLNKFIIMLLGRTITILKKNKVSFVFEENQKKYNPMVFDNGVLRPAIRLKIVLNIVDKVMSYSIFRLTTGVQGETVESVLFGKELSTEWSMFPVYVAKAIGNEGKEIAILRDRDTNKVIIRMHPEETVSSMSGSPAAPIRTVAPAASGVPVSTRSTVAPAAPGVSASTRRTVAPDAPGVPDSTGRNVAPGTSGVSSVSAPAASARPRSVAASARTRTVPTSPAGQSTADTFWTLLTINMPAQDTKDETEWFQTLEKTTSVEDMNKDDELTADDLVLADDENIDNFDPSEVEFKDGPTVVTAADESA